MAVAPSASMTTSYAARSSAEAVPTRTILPPSIRIVSPFFTLVRGWASLTETTITSPMEAYFRLLPPRTLMH